MPKSLNSGYKEINRELIELCKKANVRAQTELYSLYSRAMFNICMRMMGRREDAEDMLQESFAEVFDKLDTYRFDASFGAWVKRIVLNKCINQLKRRKPDLRFEDELPEIHELEEVSDYPEASLQVEKVKNALFGLPEGYRIIFSLYALEGYDHEEIALILGITESTSKTQYMRAKLKIRDKILEMP